MSVYKDEKTGKWYALAWYHDWKGEGRQKCKRGFETKKEAQEWERTFLQQNAADMDMTFAAFCELYERDRRPRLKESTWQTKENIIKNKLIPAFGKRIIDGYILDSYSLIARPKGELSGAISAAEVTLQGISQDETLTRLRQIKQCTPEKLAEWAEMLQMLTEEGAVRTAGSAAAIHAEADRYDMILNPFDPSDRE